MIIFQRKFLASAYYFSLSLCFIIPIVIFLSWNNIDSDIDDNRALPLSSFHVDSCDLSRNSAFVSGWAVVDGVTNSKIELFTSMQRRPDVSAYLKSPGTYDKSGFYASKRSLTNEFNSNYILISLTDLNGKKYEAKFECV